MRLEFVAIALLLTTSVSCRKSGDRCTSTPPGFSGLGSAPCDPGYSCRFDSSCDVAECEGTCVPSCRDAGCAGDCRCTNASFGTNLCLGSPDAGVHACDWPP